MALSNDVVYQLNPSTFLKTGVNFSTIPGSGHVGIEFNGEHLILGEQGLDVLYKIICIEPSSGGGGGGRTTAPIPGFEIVFILLSMVTLVGIYFIVKQKKIFVQQV